MHSVREFVELAFYHVGIEIEWTGHGLEEKGINKHTGEVIVEVDSNYFRPAEVDQLLGDPTKSKTLLGWNPTNTSFNDLVRIMVKADMEKVAREDIVKWMFDGGLGKENLTFMKN
jgi:GDPmannose 4,6-dehydratase